MKLRLSIIALIMACSAFAAPERVVVSSGDLTELSRYLTEGWTVKEHSSSLSINTEVFGGKREVLLVFVLVPPPDEVLEAAFKKRQEEAKAAFERRRAEYLAKQPKVEKP